MEKLRLDWRAAVTPLVAALALSYLLVAASYWSKTPCLGPPYDEVGHSHNLSNAYRLLCLTDIQALWVGRGVDEHQFPYVEGRLDPGEGPPGWLVDGAVEYPVLTGIFMWAAGLPASNSGEYVAVTAMMLLPVALLIAWQLAKLVGWRSLIWAAAPALVFYSVYNWDLLPVAWTLGAVLAWRRGRYGLAGVCLGLGAATKIYPGFFLLPLVIERWLARDRRGAVTVAAAGAGSWLAANAPFMLINFDGWWATYAFQAERTADLSTNSIYFWGFPHWSPQLVDRLSAAVIAVCWLLALALGFLLRHRHGSYPWIQVSAAMLFSFLAFNKVYSPQYFLWVLPFLALIALRWGWWVGYWGVDVMLFVGLMRWYHDSGDSLAQQAASMGGWIKSVLLMLLFFAVLVTPLAIRDRPGVAGPRSRIARGSGPRRPASVPATAAGSTPRSRPRPNPPRRPA